MDNSVQLIYAGRTNSLTTYGTNFSNNNTNTTNSSNTKGRSAMSGDTETRARVLADRLTEIARILANEPSLALYRIEEHVRKAVPRLATQRSEVAKLDRDISGHVSDVDCVLTTLRSMGRSRSSFQSIGEMARNALFLKQQLDYDKRRRAVTSGVATSAEQAAAAADDDPKRHSATSTLPKQQSVPVAPSATGVGGGGGAASSSATAATSVLESARTFLRAKTLDYSQNLMRRAQATKSVEIVATASAPAPPSAPPQQPPPLSLPPPVPPPPAVAAVPSRPHRSSSAGSAAQLLLTALNTVVEMNVEDEEPQPAAVHEEVQQLESANNSHLSSVVSKDEP